MDSHSPANIDGTPRRRAADMAVGVCRIGSMTWWKSRGDFLNCSGNSAVEEPVTAGDGREKNSWRRAIVSFSKAY